MPTYDYACRDCGATIEVIHAMTADGPTTCDRCGGALRRVLYPAGIIFKGAGFYRTDSRAGSNGGAAAPPDTAPAPKPKAEAEGGDSGGSGATAGTTSATPKGAESGTS